jgi:CRP/FNR family transcriptional regulator, cyclic AMP receptor protein
VGVPPAPNPSPHPAPSQTGRLSIRFAAQLIVGDPRTVVARIAARSSCGKGRVVDLMPRGTGTTSYEGYVRREQAALDEARRLLEKCSLFSGLSADERAAVAARAHVRSFRAGETIFAMGSPGDQMMAVLSGTVRISVPSAEGKELLLALIRPGEVFGELTVLDGKERSADAIAEDACTLASLRRHDVLSFFERNPGAWPKLVQVLCHRLRHTDQVFAEVALLQLPVRLAKTMLRLLDLPSSTSTAANTPTIRFSQRELASMVGGTRESVNRCLRNWQQAGIVRVTEEGLIIITNRSVLESMAEPT